jgi:CHAD domain-containing protein
MRKNEGVFAHAGASGPARPEPDRTHPVGGPWHESFPADHDLRGAQEIVPTQERLLEASLSVKECVRRLVGPFHRSFLANIEGSVTGSDINALHDLRIAIRRIRTVLRAFRRSLRKTSAKRIDADLKNLNQCLGPVRDLDVWIAFCEKESTSGGFSNHRLWPKFIAFQKELRRLQHTTVRRHLRGAGFYALRTRIDRFLEVELPEAGGSASEPLGPVSRRALLKSLRRMSKLGGLRHSCVAEELHELRIELRRIRYYCGFFEEMLGPRIHKLSRRAHRVERVLGEMRDADLALARVTREGPRPPRLLVKELRRLARADEAVVDAEWQKLADPEFIAAIRRELKHPCWRGQKNAEARLAAHRGPIGS